MIPALQPPDRFHLLGAQGWLELGNHVEADAELDKITPPLRAHPAVLEVRWAIYAALSACAKRFATTLLSLQVTPPSHITGVKTGIRARTIGFPARSAMAATSCMEAARQLKSTRMFAGGPGRGCSALSRAQASQRSARRPLAVFARTVGRFHPRPGVSLLETAAPGRRTLGRQPHVPCQNHQSSLQRPGISIEEPTEPGFTALLHQPQTGQAGGADGARLFRRQRRTARRVEGVW